MSGGRDSEVDAGGVFGTHTPVIARSLRRSDPADFWDGIGQGCKLLFVWSINGNAAHVGSHVRRVVLLWPVGPASVLLRQLFPPLLFGTHRPLILAAVLVGKLALKFAVVLKPSVLQLAVVQGIGHRAAWFILVLAIAETAVGCQLLNGMGRTAERVRTLWQKRLLGGYDMDPAEALGEGFEDARRDMVVVRGIAVHGVCPHHLVPFRGVAHVAYLPGGRLHGFGRIARMVDAIGHRFTYQEWMTRDIAEALVAHGKAAGGACVIEAEQLCLLLGEDRRGDERVVTQAFTGAFEASDQLRTEFLRAIAGKLP